MKSSLDALPVEYRKWIVGQQQAVLAIGMESRRKTAEDLLANASAAAGRIERGIQVLSTDALSLLAFRVANLAMANAARQRLKISDPKWRPSNSHLS